MKFESAIRQVSWKQCFLFVILASLMLSPTNSKAEADVEGASPWKMWLGGGGVFYEGDEPNESGQMYEFRLGYDLNPRITFEAGLGGAPFLEGNDFGAPSSREATFNGKNSPGENWFVKPNLNALYHIREEHEASWDPYLAIGAGALYYGKRREDSNWEGYAGLGGGIAYPINDAWSIRGDYQVAAAGEDGEVTQFALVFLSYDWSGRSGSGAGSGSEGALGGPSSSPLQTIYFDFDSSTLSGSSKTKLQQNAEWLKSNPDSDVSLEGHCDERGTNEYNMALGQRRAQSAYDYLKNLGVEKKRMSTNSFGEETPADSGHNEEAWSKNRRTESVVK